MTHHTVTITAGGRTYTAVVTGYAECDACRQRIYANSRPAPTDDGMTAQDWQQAQAAAAERAQAADDAALYGGTGRDDRNVGY